MAKEPQWHWYETQAQTVSWTDCNCHQLISTHKRRQQTDWL